jgi:hypothetical protein
MSYGPASFESGYFGEGSVLDNWYNNRKDRFLTDPLVIKFHYPGEKILLALQESSNRNIYTFRDPRDACSSYMYFFRTSFDQSVKAILNCLYFYDKYKSLGNCLVVRYEHMVENPIEQIERIQAFLGIVPSAENIRSVCSLTSMTAAKIISKAIDPDKNVDPTTQIHRHHIHSGKIGRWKKDLSDYQKELVNSKFLPWLHEYD